MTARQHGTYVKFKREGCHCPPCTDAARTYSRRQSKRLALYGPVYVDAQPVRAHVQRLVDGPAPMTCHQIAVLAGINRNQVRHLLYGSGGRAPAKGLRPETAAALLAVQPGGWQPAAEGTCDATGTRRRLQALMANGWPASTLARLLCACEEPRVLQVARRGRVRSATALAVRELYERLADTTGPSPATATRYRARGWLPPIWWDDDTIDDPTHTPDTRDLGAAERRREEQAERIAQVAHLTRQGLPAHLIADILGVSTRQVVRDRGTLTDSEDVAS